MVAMSVVLPRVMCVCGHGSNECCAASCDVCVVMVAMSVVLPRVMCVCGHGSNECCAAGDVCCRR